MSPTDMTSASMRRPHLIFAEYVAKTCEEKIHKIVESNLKQYTVNQKFNIPEKDIEDKDFSKNNILTCFSKSYWNELKRTADDNPEHIDNMEWGRYDNYKDKR